MWEIHSLIILTRTFPWFSSCVVGFLSLVFCFQKEKSIIMLLTRARIVVLSIMYTIRTTTTQALILESNRIAQKGPFLFILVDKKLGLDIIWQGLRFFVFLNAGWYPARITCMILFPHSSASLVSYVMEVSYSLYMCMGPLAIFELSRYSFFRLIIIVISISVKKNVITLLY